MPFPPKKGGEALVVSEEAKQLLSKWIVEAGAPEFARKSRSHRTQPRAQAQLGFVT